jgi:release factor glutamine methyltransferase
MRIIVTEFEPSMALYVDDSDPLIFYRHILEISRSLLSSKGKIYFEINEAMGNEMKKLTGSYGFSEVKVIKDLNNKDRFVKALK